jgi:hypothetical protein
MCGVEKRAVAAVVCAVSTDTSDELMLIPLVYDHELRAGQRAIQIEFAQRVLVRTELRVALVKRSNRRLAVLLHKVLPAPRIGWFVNDYVVAPRDQLSRDAAEKMRVSVVPI